MVAICHRDPCLPSRVATYARVDQTQDYRLKALRGSVIRPFIAVISTSMSAMS
jgi:hypothetical protein